MKDMKELDKGEMTKIIMDEFCDITESEIMGLFRRFVSRGLNENEAWCAITASIALDMAFGRSYKLVRIVH